MRGRMERWRKPIGWVLLGDSWGWGYGISDSQWYPNSCHVEPTNELVLMTSKWWMVSWLFGMEWLVSHGSCGQKLHGKIGWTVVYLCIADCTSPIVDLICKYLPCIVLKKQTQTFAYECAHTYNHLFNIHEYKMYTHTYIYNYLYIICSTGNLRTAYIALFSPWARQHRTSLRNRRMALSRWIA